MCHVISCQDSWSPCYSSEQPVRLVTDQRYCCVKTGRLAAHFQFQMPSHGYVVLRTPRAAVNPSVDEPMPTTGVDVFSTVFAMAAEQVRRSSPEADAPDVRIMNNVVVFFAGATYFSTRRARSSCLARRRPV